MSNSCFERGRLRHADGGSIQICPFPTHGGKQFIADRQVDQAANGCLVADQAIVIPKSGLPCWKLAEPSKGSTIQYLTWLQGYPRQRLRKMEAGFWRGRLSRCRTISTNGNGQPLGR